LSVDGGGSIGIFTEVPEPLGPEQAHHVALAKAGGRIFDAPQRDAGGGLGQRRHHAERCRQDPCSILLPGPEQADPTLLARGGAHGTRAGGNLLGPGSGQQDEGWDGMGHAFTMPAWGPDRQPSGRIPGVSK